MVTQQKVRIVLKSFDHKVLDVSTEQIVETAEQTALESQVQYLCLQK